MQQVMWQHDIVGVAHYTMDCFDTPGDAPDDESISSSSAPGGWIVVIQSMTHSMLRSCQSRKALKECILIGTPVLVHCLALPNPAHKHPCLASCA